MIILQEEEILFTNPPILKIAQFINRIMNENIILIAKFKKSFKIVNQHNLYLNFMVYMIKIIKYLFKGNEYKNL